MLNFKEKEVFFGLLLMAIFVTKDSYFFFGQLKEEKIHFLTLAFNHNSLFSPIYSFSSFSYSLQAI